MKGAAMVPVLCGIACILLFVTDIRVESKSILNAKTNNCGKGRKVDDVWTEAGCSQCKCKENGLDCKGCAPQKSSSHNKDIKGNPDKEYPFCCPGYEEENQEQSEHNHPRIEVVCEGDKQLNETWTKTGCLGCVCDHSGSVCQKCDLVEGEGEVEEGAMNLDYPNCCPKPKRKK